MNYINLFYMIDSCGIFGKIGKKNYYLLILFELLRKKTCLRGSRPGPTQTKMYSLRRMLEARNFGFRKKRDCAIYVAKEKALISCTATTQLICVFVFAYAKIRVSHDVAHLLCAQAQLYHFKTSNLYTK